MNYFSNMVLIRGTGRNVGKTLSACTLIAHLAKDHEPVAVKISPHFHELPDYEEFIYRSDDIVILEEKLISNKDSSRMLQAGAKKVFYVQAKNPHVLSAFNLLGGLLSPDCPVVVESGGLYDYIEPALLVNVIGDDCVKKISVRENTKAVNLPYNEVLHFNWQSVNFVNGKFEIYA